MSNIPDSAMDDAFEEVKLLKERLQQWEAAFETTNPAQAKAEHLAVLAKRTALQAEVLLLKEEVRKLYPYDDRSI